MMRKLTAEESQKVRDAIKIRGWKQNKVAEVMGVSRAYFSNMLSRRTLQPKYAMKLDEIFGFDKELDFLGNYYAGMPAGQEGRKETSNALPPIFEIDSAWNGLYEAHAVSLRRIYIQQPVEKKKQIIGELEKLIESYK